MHTGYIVSVRLCDALLSHCNAFQSACRPAAYSSPEGLPCMPAHRPASGGLQTAQRDHSAKSSVRRWLAIGPEHPASGPAQSPAAGASADGGEPVQQRPDDFADRGKSIATAIQYNLVQEDHSLVRIDGCVLRASPA